MEYIDDIYRICSGWQSDNYMPIRFVCDLVHSDKSGSIFTKRLWHHFGQYLCW